MNVAFWIEVDADSIDDVKFKSDPRCSMKVGDRVKKSLMEKDGSDRHQLGHPGKVVGSLYVPVIPANFIDMGYSHEVYLVHFDGDKPDELSIVAGHRIKKQ